MGKAANLFHDAIPEEHKRAYKLLKESFLVASGVTSKAVRRLHYSLHKRPNHNVIEIAQEVDTTVERMTLECKSLQDVKREWKFSRMLTLYPQAVAEFVETRKPKTLQEMAVLIQEYTSDRWTERRPVQGDSIHYQPLDRRREEPQFKGEHHKPNPILSLSSNPRYHQESGMTDVVAGSWNAGSVTEEAIRNGTALSKGSEQ